MFYISQFSKIEILTRRKASRISDRPGHIKHSRRRERLELNQKTEQLFHQLWDLKEEKKDRLSDSKGSSQIS
jgi:hypothetical protein